MHIGQKIKGILLERGISNVSFAKKFGTSSQNMGKLLAKEEWNTTNLLIAAKALSIPVSELLYDSSNALQMAEPSIPYIKVTDKRIDDLKLKLAFCEKEKEYLQEINNLLRQSSSK